MNTEYFTKCRLCGVENDQIDIIEELCTLCEKQQGRTDYCKTCDAEQDADDFKEGFCTSCYYIYQYEID